MPYTIELTNTPDAAMLRLPWEGEAAGAVREFISSEDGDRLPARLEGWPTAILERLPAHVPASQVDHLVTILRPDRTGTVYVNECAVEASSASRGFRDVELPEDAGVIIVLSAGWRKALFVDLTPLAAEPVTRAYDLGRLLRAYARYLENQQIFNVTSAETDFALQQGWFPFVTLSDEMKRLTASCLKSRLSLRPLLPRLVQDVVRRLAAPGGAARDVAATGAADRTALADVLRAFRDGRYREALAASSAVLEPLREEPASHPLEWLLPRRFSLYLRCRGGAARPETDRASEMAAAAIDLLTLEHLALFACVAPPPDRSGDAVADEAAPRDLHRAPLSACVRETVEYLERHFDEHLTWRDVAAAVRRHHGYIATAFRRQTGMTMREYVRALRVGRAAELIRAGEKIDATMLVVGYRSKRTFYDDFRRRIGVTPGTYRAFHDRRVT